MPLTRYKRAKLRAHDQGINRHNKGVAYEDKRQRLQQEHEQYVYRLRTRPWLRSLGDQNKIPKAEVLDVPQWAKDALAQEQAERNQQRLRRRKH